MIKRIELINFMSHQHTVIEPSDGLTVLIGPNNCGKSAIINALQVLCTNPKSTYVLRHGSKECKVIVQTDTGDEICWSRKKSGSPKYEINGTVFDRLNGKVPEELHKVLRLPAVEADKESYDVHFGEQRSPIFLLADKEKAAAQFFASSSDAIRMVEMQTLHKAKIRKSTSELDRLQEEKTELDAEIEALSPVAKIRADADVCQKLYDQLQTQIATRKALQSSVEALGRVGVEAAFLQTVSTALTDLPSPPTLSDTAAVKGHLSPLMRLESQTQMIATESSVLQPLVEPPTISPTRGLRLLIDQLTATARSNTRLKRTGNALQPLAPPPQLGDTQMLRQQINQLEQTHASLIQLDASYQSMQELAEPPAMAPVGALARLQQELQSSIRQAQALEQKSVLLADVPAPTAPASTQLLEESIENLQQLNRQHDQLGAALAQTQEELAAAQSQFEAWIAQHPQCPTCGSAVSIESLPYTGNRTAETSERALENGNDEGEIR